MRSAAVPGPDESGRWLGLSIAVLILSTAIGIARIVLTYPVVFETIDEPYHVAVGIHWLAGDRARLDRGGELFHPPLARMAVGLLPYVDGLRPLDGYAAPDDEGNALLHGHGAFQRNLSRARAGILPFFVLGTLMVWLWARHTAGDVAAAGAAVLFTTLPPILAHAGLATTDLPLCAMLAAALYAFVRWIETPGPLTGGLLGAAVGLAVICKFSALLFLPACFLAVSLTTLISPSRRPALGGMSRQWRSGAVALLAAFLVVWAGYRFQVKRLTGPEARPHRAFASAGKFLANHPRLESIADAVVEAPVPALDLYRGVRELRSDTGKGYLTFFMGRFAQRGWWYFFPVLVIVKTPLAFLVLLVPGLLGLWRRGPPGRRWIFLAPAASAIAVLLVCMAAHLNLGLRHVLPIYGPLSVVAGVGLADLLRDGKTKRAAFAAGILLLAWQLGASAASHPDYLPYFNELALGHPERIVVDSDLDWGQDLWRLRDRLAEVGASKVTLGYFWGKSEGRFWERMEKQGLPPAEPLRPYQPASGWVAISEWTLTTYGERCRIEAGGTKGAFAWLEKYPFERIGKSIRLYHIPEGEAPRPSGAGS